MGGGIDVKRLKKLTSSLQLESRVTFLGWKNVQQQKKIHHSHDVFVSASDFETFGLTYVEALATERKDDELEKYKPHSSSLQMIEVYRQTIQSFRAK